MRQPRHRALQGLLILSVAALSLPPAQASEGKPVTLRIATWNVALFPARGTGWIGHGPEHLASLRKYADRMDADVVALQEVYGVEAASLVFDPGRYDFHVASESDRQRTGFAYKKDLGARGIKVTKNTDYTALDVGGLRRGTDLTIETRSGKLRLLSVHLKSGCFDRGLDSKGRACQKLKRQVPILEAWIDARAKEGTPFAVLGDFNRRFDAPGDDFWPEIDDGIPPNADLMRVTEGRTSRCWGSRYPRFIDHIVLGRTAARWLDATSFEEHVYDAADAAYGRRPSDHCPLSVVLQIGATGINLEPTPPQAAPPPAPARRQTAASIKGNISRDGRRIYHRPDCPGYARTVIHEERGERWFSTEAEARAAGWTKAKNCP